MAASSTNTAATEVDPSASTPVMVAATSSVPFQSTSDAFAVTTESVVVEADTLRDGTTICRNNESSSKNTNGEIRSDNSKTNFASAAVIDTTVKDNRIVPPTQGSTTTNKKNIASKADRLKDLQLMESFFTGVPLPVGAKTNVAKAVENHIMFNTMEILQEQLLQANHTSDDERLLSQIIQSSEEIPKQSSNTQNLWDQGLYERQATGGSSSTATTVGSRGYYSALGHIQDQTTTTVHPNRPRLSSSLSRQSSAISTTMEHFNIGFDAGNMNSIAWKPMFQQDHQEIPYSPAHIFADRNAGICNTVPAMIARGIDNSTTTTLAALPSSTVPTALSKMEMPPTTNTATPEQTAAIHTAGAQTLLFAAQVLHEGTNHSNDNHSGAESSASRRKSRLLSGTAVAAANSSSDEVPRVSKIRGRNIKKQDSALMDNTTQNKKDVPVGHATVENGRIALLIPDADITNNDVLLGRGGRTNHHVGNATYRTYKESLQEEYLHATKDEKTCISNRLVNMIHEKRGRFVKAYEPMKNNTTGIVEFWYEVDLLTARKKASQALREINTPENRAAKRAKYSASK